MTEIATTAQTFTLSPAKLKEIDNSAKSFEGMFLSEMMGHMFDTVQTDSMFGGGQAEDTWRGMLVEEYSKQIVKAGGVGISDAIRAEMISMQEAADK